jgi:hypothetical protein
MTILVLYVKGALFINLQGCALFPRAVSVFKRRWSGILSGEGERKGLVLFIIFPLVYISFYLIQ